MSKLFRGLGGKKRPGKIPRKPKVTPPYSRSGSQQKKDHNQSSPSKKTVIGNMPGQPFSGPSGNNELICPQCQYHLRAEPSASSPCPNCGFVGSGNVQDTHSDRKTVDVSSLNMDTPSDMSSFCFELVAEKTGSRIKIESEDSELTLNRSHLDPDNQSISNEQHLLMRFQDGRVFLSDLSSNGSTFIQVLDRAIIAPGTGLVLGNQIYLFNRRATGGGVQEKNTQTQKFGGFAGSNEYNEYELVEEKNRKKIKLTSGINILNRSSLDPGNASISGQEHAILENQAGTWYISDVSSNQATFIQVKSELVLSKGIKIIVGNMVFTFEY